METVIVRCKHIEGRTVWQRKTEAGWTGTFTTKKAAEQATIIGKRVLCPIKTKTT